MCYHPFNLLISCDCDQYNNVIISLVAHDLFNSRTNDPAPLQSPVVFPRALLSAPSCSPWRRFQIQFHCSADDSQLYISVHSATHSSIQLPTGD